MPFINEEKYTSKTSLDQIERSEGCNDFYAIYNITYGYATGSFGYDLDTSKANEYLQKIKTHFHSVHYCFALIALGLSYLDGEKNLQPDISVAKKYCDQATNLTADYQILKYAESFYDKLSNKDPDNSKTYDNCKIELYKKMLNSSWDNDETKQRLPDDTSKEKERERICDRLYDLYIKQENYSEIEKLIDSLTYDYYVKVSTSFKENLRFRYGEALVNSSDSSNWKKGIDLLNKIAGESFNSKKADAYYLLGKLYLDGQKVEWDYKTAWDYFMQSNSPLANTMLNQMKTFQHCPETKRGPVEIPDGVKTIGYHAFYNCFNVTKIIIPASVENIDEKAFEFDSTDNATRHPVIIINKKNQTYSYENGILYNNKTNFLEVCLQCCSGTIAIPASIIKIKEDAFSNCDDEIRKITIPQGVTTLYSKTMKCVSKEIAVKAGNPNYFAQDGILYDANSLICCPRKKSGVITIPQQVNNIPTDAFKNRKYLDCIFVKKGNDTFESREGSLYNKKTNECLFEAKKHIIGSKLTNMEERLVVQAYLDGSLNDILSKYGIREENKDTLKDKNLNWCYKKEQLDSNVEKQLKFILELTDYFD